VLHEPQDLSSDLDGRRLRWPYLLMKTEEPPMAHTAPSEIGFLIALVLKRSWRRQSEAPGLSPAALAEITPRLLQTGAGALAWWRVRGTELTETAAGQQLRQAHRQHALWAALHERAVSQTMALLEAAGVEPLLAKGWAVARLYPEPGLRPYGDVDLCVRPAQYALAQRAVRGLADLHAGLGRKRDGQAFALLDDRTLDALYERSQRVRLGEVEACVLGPEDHLRLLCLHMLVHGVCRPLWLCDIGAALESRPAEFDWHWFLSGDPRRTEWALCALGLAHQLLGARLEDTPVAERAQSLPRWLVPTVVRQWRQGFVPRIPLTHFLRHPAGAWDELCRHWPNEIEATVNVRGPFNAWPRLPFQIGAACLRTGQFLAELAPLRRGAG
jgi:hypothetical protein